MHLDNEVNGARIVSRCELDHAVAERDAQHAQVNARRKPVVEAHFLRAHRAAALGAAVVEKVEDERLFELVRTLARKEHE